MFDTPEARGVGNCVDSAGLEPDLPCDLPSWNYSDVLNGLDQFMEMVPNFPTGSDGSGASEGGHQEQPSGHEVHSPRAGSSGKNEKEKRRQYKNKVVSAFATLPMSTSDLPSDVLLALPLPPVSVVRSLQGTKTESDTCSNIQSHYVLSDKLHATCLCLQSTLSCACSWRKKGLESGSEPAQMTWRLKSKPPQRSWRR